jgi:hypothetical protein
MYPPAGGVVESIGSKGLAPGIGIFGSLASDTVSVYIKQGA